ncbi:MAG: hypothetical protein ACLGG9_01830 [Thermoleophilia bacterium]|jgi:uncharacterized membrane protein
MGILLAIVLLVAVLVVAVAVLGVSGARTRLGPPVDPVEARRVANLEAERLLAERYRAGEISLEQFEGDLADLLARRDRLDGPGR